MPIVAFDCIYNRESTHNKALYFADSDALAAALRYPSDYAAIGQAMQEIALKEYQWSVIAKRYEGLY